MDVVRITTMTLTETLMQLEAQHPDKETLRQEWMTTGQRWAVRAVTLCPDLDQRNGEPTKLNEQRRSRA